MAANWQQGEKQLHIITTGKGMGCLYIGISIIGFLILSTTLLVFLAQITASKSINIFLYLIIFFFGWLFFSAGFSRKSFDFRSEIVLDTEKQWMTFRKSPDDPQIHYQLADMAYIHLMETTKSASSDSRYTVYDLSMIHKDGSQFWLDEFRDRQACNHRARDLQKFLQLPIKDAIDGSLNHNGQNSFQEISENIIELQPSKYLNVERKNGQTSIQLKAYHSLSKTMTYINVFGLFFSVPIYIVSQFFTTLQDWQNIGSYLFLAFGGVFVTLFISIVLVILVLQLKTYTIQLQLQTLTVHLNFKFALLNHYLGKKLTIDTDDIRSVRVNRGNEGHFWLSIHTRKSGKYRDSTGYLFQSGFFPKNKKPAGHIDQMVLPLWEIVGTQKCGLGPDYRDLYIIETLLQEELQLKERQVD